MFKLVLPTLGSRAIKKREVDDATITKVAGMANDFYTIKQQLGSILGSLNQIDNDLDDAMMSMDSSESYYATTETLANEVATAVDALNSLGV